MISRNVVIESIEEQGCCVIEDAPHNPDWDYYRNPVQGKRSLIAKSDLIDELHYYQVIINLGVDCLPDYQDGYEVYTAWYGKEYADAVTVQ